MIQEIAVFDIKETDIEKFKTAMPAAIKVISASPGFISLKFQQCMEKPTEFLALIQWETLEDHTIIFRESPLFLEWRAILSPFFNSAPVAKHYNFL